MSEPTTEPIYVYRWKKHRPEWKGRACVVEARGKMNSVKIRFTDTGERAIVSRYAVRRQHT